MQGQELQILQPNKIENLQNGLQHITYFGPKRLKRGLAPLIWHNEPERLVLVVEDQVVVDAYQTIQREAGTYFAFGNFAGHGDFAGFIDFQSCVSFGGTSTDSLCWGVRPYGSDPSLQRAIRNGFADGVRRALKRGDDPNSTTPNGRSILSVAIQGRDWGVVSVLMNDSRLAVSGSDAKWLPWMAKDAPISMVLAFVDIPGIDVDAREPDRPTALVEAVSKGRIELVRELLARGADIHVTVKGEPIVLASAIREPNEDLIDLLLKAGAQPVLGRGLYTLAQSNRDLAYRLIQTGADASVGTKSFNVLQWAGRTGDVQLAQLVLSKSGSAFDLDRRLVALRAACRKGQLDFVRWFLPSLGTLTPSQLQTLLTASVTQPEVLRFLLRTGIPVSPPSGVRSNALSTAASYNSIEAVSQLLSLGADPQAPDRAGRLPLIEAVKHRHAAMVAMLLANGAKIDARDEYGLTPLMVVSDSGYREVLEFQNLQRAAPKQPSSGIEMIVPGFERPEGPKFEWVNFLTPPNWDKLGAKTNQLLKQLLRAGADPNVPDSDGWTPLMRAVQVGYADKVKLLLEYGATPGSDLRAIAEQGRKPEAVLPLLPD